jgi:hypothetical protein
MRGFKPHTCCCRQNLNYSRSRVEKGKEGTEKKDKAMQLEAVKHKNEKLARQASLLHKCMVYIRNQSRHLLAMVEVPDWRMFSTSLYNVAKKTKRSLAFGMNWHKI